MVNRPYIEDLDEMMAEIIAECNSTGLNNQNPITNEILDECVILLQRAIKEKVYDYYTPHMYGYYRGMSALNKDWIKIEATDMGVADILIKPYPYESAVFENLDVRENVWHWVNYGHDDGIGEKRKDYNQYHRYEGRFFLEYAKKLIEDTYDGVTVSIIDKYPLLNY